MHDRNPASHALFVYGKRLYQEWGVDQYSKVESQRDAPPSSLCDPKRVQRVGFAKMVRNLVSLPASNTKRGRGVVLEAPGLD
jgi:hypothetical protein